MTMREQFLQVVEKYGIDEVWVNFDEAFDHPHAEDGDAILVFKKGVEVGNVEILNGTWGLIHIFVPTLKDLDIEDPNEEDSVHLSYMIVPGLDQDRVAKFEKVKETGFRLLYSKEAGIIG